MHREARTYAGSRLAPWLPRVTESDHEIPRPLVTPDEVMRLPEEDTLVFAGGKPIRGKKTPYYLDPEFRRRSAIPAPAVSDRISPQAPPCPQTDLEVAPDAHGSRPGMEEAPSGRPLPRATPQNLSNARSKRRDDDLFGGN